jgi:hypothetical protein
LKRKVALKSRKVVEVQIGWILAVTLVRLHAAARIGYAGTFPVNTSLGFSLIEI